MNNLQDSVVRLPPAEIQYPKPESLTGGHESRDYPVESLPTIMREAVIEWQAYVQAPMALVVSCLLGILAAVIQGMVLVRRDSRMVSPVSLFLLTIAEANERKSSVESGFNPPLIDWENGQAKQTAEAFIKYTAKMDTHEARVSNLKKAIKNPELSELELEELEKEYEKYLSDIPQTPLTPRLVQADATKEASVKHLSQLWPSLGVISSEAGTIFGGASLSQSSVVGPLAFYNSGWSGERVLIDRSGDGQTKLENFALSMSLAVQPAVIEKFLSKNDGMARGIGYIARTLLTCPETTQGKRLYIPPPESMPALDAMNNVTSMLLEMLPSYIDGNRLVREQVPLSAEAFEVWKCYYNATEQAQIVGAELEYTRDVAGKSADNAARLAAIFHVVDKTSKGDVPTTDKATWGEIGEEHMRMGAEVASFYLNEALRYLSVTDLPEEVQHAQIVSDKLRAHLVKRQQSTEAFKDGLRFNEITKRDLVRKLPAKVTRAKSINSLLDDLIEANHILDKAQGRNNSVVLTINPRIAEVDHDGL